MRDDSAEILFRSFLQEVLVGSSCMGRDVHSYLSLLQASKEIAFASSVHGFFAEVDLISAFTVSKRVNFKRERDREGGGGTEGEKERERVTG